MTLLIATIIFLAVGLFIAVLEMVDGTDAVAFVMCVALAVLGLVFVSWACASAIVQAIQKSGT